MKKETFLTFAGSLAALSLPAQQAAKTAPPQSKPVNVIYIMADDLGIGDLGCYGQTKIQTPAIDRMAAAGMRFTQHYSGSTVSAPSRCSLMTGMHTGHCNIRGNQGTKADDGLNYDYPLAAGEITVGDIFKRAGYATACVGKWGMGGPGSEGLPGKHGFDYFFGYLGQAHAHKYYPDFLFENDKKIVLDKKVYSHDLMMDKALDFIRNNASNPFFLYLSPTIPHAEMLVPEGELGEYDGMFPETPFTSQDGYCSQPKPKATFAAMVSRLDRDVQRIMDLLAEKGLADNTIVIFTSDNGAHAEGGHDPDFFHSTGPFRGLKRDLYEGGIRTPFIVSWPGTIVPGSVSYHVSAFWDFLPTVCDLTGVPVPQEIDGISYLPSLTGRGEQLRHGYLYWEFHERGGRRALLQDGWKLVELNVNNPGQRVTELYNLAADPGERADVAAQYPDRVKKMRTLMSHARTPSAVWEFQHQ